MSDSLTPNKSTLATVIVGMASFQSLAPIVAFVLMTVAILDSLTDRNWLLEWTKIRGLFIASGIFVLLGVLRCTRLGGANLLTSLALIFCAVGDVLGPIRFEWGASAFLFGHLLLIGAFVTLGVTRRRLILALCFVPISLVVYAAILPHVGRIYFDDVGGYWPKIEGELFSIVTGYTFVITVMVVMALGTGRRLVAAAAIIFYVSDIFVAVWKFVDPAQSYAWYCYPLYYLACFLFALTVSTRSKSADTAPVT